MGLSVNSDLSIMLYVYLAFGKLLTDSETWSFCYNSFDQGSIEAH